MKLPNGSFGLCVKKCLKIGLKQTSCCRFAAQIVGSGMLKAENINKNYGLLPVLSNVAITVNKGEIVSIVGSSGAGKSTLLHILGTLDSADVGRIWLDDHPLHDLTGKKLADFRNNHIGFVFQFHHLLPEFSGGEQQRVAVARALINQPKIVFADEPTGNLDSKNAKELHDLFVHLRDEFQQTFLIVTHNEELASMSDRTLHMKDGRII